MLHTVGLMLVLGVPSRSLGGRDVFVGEGGPVWEPSEEVRRGAGVGRFMAERGLGSYDELWRWSVTDVDGFWDAVWAHFDVLGERGNGPVRDGDPRDWGVPAGSDAAMP